MPGLAGVHFGRAFAITWLTGILLFSGTAFAAAEALRAPATSGGTVQVSVVINSRIEATFGESAVTVRANVPWQLSADCADGSRLVVPGDPTSGRAVPVPAGATNLEVVAR